MRKAERLFQLLNLLRSRRGVITAKELADTLQVSERTIYRDVQALSLSNIPIESEAGVGYRLRPGFSLPPLMFEEDELEALLFGARMVQGWSDDLMGTAAQRAMDKIRAILPDQLHARHDKNSDWLLVPDFSRHQATQFSDELRTAIKTKQQIWIRYKREDEQQSERELWPLGLVYWGKTWTLVAWCQLRLDYRMFRLDRIAQLQSQNIKFKTSETLSFKHYLSLQKM